MLKVSQEFSQDFSFEFDDDLEETGRLPFLQVINPHYKNAKLLDKEFNSYGIALPSDNAELIEFKGSPDWIESEDVKIHPQSQALLDKAFVAHSVNMVVLSYSDLEIQQKRNDRWSFWDVAYRNGVLTEAGEAIENSAAEEQEYRRIRRWLILLIDDDGNPLHDRPLQLKAKGAFGSSLFQEYRSFQDELGQAYRSGRKVKGGRFNKTAQAFTIFPFMIGYHVPKDSNKSAFTCVVERLSPVAKNEECGQSKTVDRRDRQVKVTGAPYPQFIVPRTSDLGILIGSLQQEFADFSKPNRGLSNNTDSSVDEDFSAEGFFDHSSAKMDGSTGDTEVNFSTKTQGSVPVIVPAKFMGALDCESLILNGVQPANGGAIQMLSYQPIESEVARPKADDQMVAGTIF